MLGQTSRYFLRRRLAHCSAFAAERGVFTSNKKALKLRLTQTSSASICFSNFTANSFAAHHHIHSHSLRRCVTGNSLRERKYRAVCCSSPVPHTPRPPWITSIHCVTRSHMPSLLLPSHKYSPCFVSFLFSLPNQILPCTDFSSAHMAQ